MSAEIQRDLDRFLRYYHLERSHQGYRLQVRTPDEALMQALATEALPPIVPEEREQKNEKPPPDAPHRKSRASGEY